MEDAYFTFSYSPVRVDGGVVGGILVTIQETTAVHERDRLLRESEERFAVIRDKSPLPIALTRVSDGRLEDVNDAFLNLFELRRDQAIGRSLVDLKMTTGDNRAEMLQELETNGIVRSREVSRRTRGGRRLELSVNIDRVVIGGEQFALTTFSDITQRVDAEEALRRNEEFLSFALDNAQIGAWDLDLLENRAHRSLQHDRIFGYHEALPSWSFDTFLAHVLPEERQQVERAVRQALRTQETFTLETRILRADQSLRWIWVAARMLLRADGEPTRMVGTVQDITERKEAERALQLANERLNENDRRKNEFLAMLSHELRNPLAPIRNSLQILSRTSHGSEASLRAQAVITRQVDQLTHLIDDLMDVTRITRDKVSLHRERLDLNVLAQRAVEDHRSVFEQSGVALEFSPSPSQPWVMGDRTRLAQAIGNLLQNAVKFTPRGGRTAVTVACSDPNATVTVEDSGRGIAPEIMPRLFQAFTQADESLDRPLGGLGLGLAIVKGLMELHGGSVKAGAGPSGHGASFTISMPLEATERPTLLAPQSSPETHARRILVIEDNVDAADTLRELLELDGHMVDAAYTGSEGLEKARTVRPEIVFCDIGLPEMSGFEVALALRADPMSQFPHTRPTLVALTGYTQPDDLRRVREAGFDTHLAKPASFEAIEALIGQLPKAVGSMPKAAEEASLGTLA
jgi:PAS domain S-box-containing protein